MNHSHVIGINFPLQKLVKAATFCSMKNNEIFLVTYVAQDN